MTGRERIVIDATNISRKDRTPYFQYRKYGYRYIAKVFNLPESICVLRDSSRDRKVGNRVISKMLKRFEMPCFWEGFDEIDLMYSPVIPFQNVINSMIDFDQMNPHHSLTLFNHCMKTAELISNQANNYKELVLSAKIHDVGKLYTMSLESMPNESVKAHYYSHQNVGAYVSLCLDDDIDESLRIKRAQYIQWHMLPYFLTTEKSKNKYKNMMGSFYDDLMILHEADEKAH
jgi:hypothetical protein